MPPPPRIWLSGKSQKWLTPRKHWRTKCLVYPKQTAWPAKGLIQKQKYIGHRTGGTKRALAACVSTLKERQTDKRTDRRTEDRCCTFPAACIRSKTRNVLGHILVSSFSILCNHKDCKTLFFCHFEWIFDCNNFLSEQCRRVSLWRAKLKDSHVAD